MYLAVMPVTVEVALAGLTRGVRSIGEEEVHPRVSNQQGLHARGMPRDSLG